MSDDLIPPELVEILESARAGKWHGRIELHLHDGEVQTITPVRNIRVRRSPPVVGPKVHCPADGKPMESRDYGNLWVCACGAKRTKAQLAQAGLLVGNGKG